MQRGYSWHIEEFIEEMKKKVGTTKKKQQAGPSNQEEKYERSPKVNKQKQTSSQLEEIM